MSNHTAIQKVRPKFYSSETKDIRIYFDLYKNDARTLFDECALTVKPKHFVCPLHAGGDKECKMEISIE